MEPESGAQGWGPRTGPGGGDPGTTHTAGGEVLATSERVARGLWYGSADPHGVGDLDLARRPRRAPTAHLGTHLAASEAELKARPFPRVNVPPMTAPKPPPAPQRGGAPVVTRRDQVIPQKAHLLVVQWRRQLQRCFKAAAAGEVARARRFRPPDLWLPHEENSVPATAAWDWDLEPLSRGLPATPLQTSPGLAWAGTIDEPRSG